MTSFACLLSRTAPLSASTEPISDPAGFDDHHRDRVRVAPTRQIRNSLLTYRSSARHRAGSPEFFAPYTQKSDGQAVAPTPLPLDFLYPRGVSRTGLGYGGWRGDSGTGGLAPWDRAPCDHAGVKARP